MTKLLPLCERCYAVLAPIDHQWIGRHTIEGQRLLTDLRDVIADGRGESSEDVQNQYSAPLKP